MADIKSTVPAAEAGMANPLAKTYCVAIAGGITPAVSYPQGKGLHAGPWAVTIDCLRREGEAH